MMDYIFIGVAIIIIVLFTFCTILALYLLILLFYSRGYKISPTITSDSKSIKLISNYVKEYILKSNREKIRILDIGSGYGTMLFKIFNNLKNLENKKIELVGYEISSFAYKISKFRNKYKDITIFKEDIENLKDFNFDIVLTFILTKQQKLFLNIYRNFPSGTLIIANSLQIPFEKTDNFKLIETIKVHYRWNIYIYRKF